MYLVGLGIFAPSVSAAALSAPGGDVSDPVVRQVDIARPAVVRIVTTIDGQLTVRFTDTVSAVFPQSGDSYAVEGLGSGAFISAHGDILTADHVVNPPHDQSLDDALYTYAAQDVADYINTHFEVSAPYSAQDAYNALASGELPSTTTYAKAHSDVYLSTSYAGSFSVKKIDDVPAVDHAAVDKIEAQSAVNNSDVAIIHVSGMDNMPSIQMGDSSQVAELDNLTVIGYPGLGDLSDSPTDFLTSSINKVYVSALKSTDSGAPVIQVGGNVEHGDSGGPALDQNGNIVGIVSFGYSGTDGDYGQTSFLQASNSAEALIKSLDLNTAPGTVEKAWAQGIDDYASTDSGHWQKASQELHALALSDPGFQGINSFLNYARSQAAHEPSTSGGIGTGTLLVIVLVIVLLLLLLGFGFYMLFRRNTRAVVVAPGGVQYPAGTYSAYPQQSGVYSSQSGLYPSAGTGYGASAPYAQSLLGVQPAASAVSTYPNYASPAAYGAQAEQVPQTPRVVGPPTPLPQAPATPLPATAGDEEQRPSAFSLPPVQTPRPFTTGSAQSPLSTWPPSAPASESAQSGTSQSEQEAPALSDAEKLAEVMSKSATYTVPAHQRESLSARMLDAAPGATPSLPSNDAWPTFAANRETATSEDQRTVQDSSAARMFPASRRPSTSEVVAAEEAEENTPPPYIIAPCGHPNPLGVRYCLVCGRAIANPDTSESREQ